MSLKPLDYSLRSPFGPPVAFNALRAYVPAFAGMTDIKKTEQQYLQALKKTGQ